LGSPFRIVADYARDPSKVCITGCDDERVQIGEPLTLTVNAKPTEYLPVTAQLPSHLKQPDVRETDSRIYSVTFTPTGKAGTQLPLEIFYGGELIK
ncbi:unnamed protein product, partial [Gongylonema pulchrum]|uniref:A2M domain-containing protein n=1 Tax=Gongylonema pulchrum TaxID=637853 RepID=A0A183F130_9BILA